MAPDVLSRALDPFYTTKPIGQGTGLGLSMVYGFAKQSGGQVRLYSEVGQGTTVKIYLPRHHGKPDQPEEEQSRRQLPRAEGSETVLVVDDEPTIRMLIGDTLSELGYQAIEVGDAASGLKVLDSDAEIDLVITDVGLPGGMNGKQMADIARTKRPGLKVLFITGYAENAAVANGHLEPGMQVMSKPFAMDQLAARIRSIITSA
jgi:CheY-like chemotaxis protein